MYNDLTPPAKQVGFGFGHFHFSEREKLQCPQQAKAHTQKQMLTYSKLFQINFTKMHPYEFKTFMDIVERYSTAFKSAKGNVRGKKKRK